MQGFLLSFFFTRKFYLPKKQVNNTYLKNLVSFEDDSLGLLRLVKLSTQSLDEAHSNFQP
jgi:hypothetical protein